MKNYILLITFVVLVSIANIVSAQSGSDNTQTQVPSQNENLTLATGTPLGNTLYAVTFSSSGSNTSLYTIDPTDETISYIGNVGIGYVTDLEFYGNDLYAITFNSFIQIDPETGQGNIIGDFNFGYGDMNSLAISPDGTPYAASLDGTLISINRRTGEGSYIGNFGANIFSSGDMAFNEDRILYASVGRSSYFNDWLATINLNTGTATLIGDIGYDDVWGLAFKDGQLYGVSDDGELLQINTTTGAGSELVDYSLSWAGLTISPACLNVVDGICVISDLEHSYIAKIDLSNPDINVELASDLINPANGLFGQKRVEEFVESNSGAGNNGEIARYFVAINGTAKSDEFGNTYSQGSILGINGTTYGFQCVGGSNCIDQPQASFFPFRYQSPIKIHRSGVDFPADGGSIAKDYIQNQIGTSIFTVGYRSTILDTTVSNGTIVPNFPEYVASSDDRAFNGEKTALGLSQDGSELFLATVDNTVSTQELATQLMYWGADRAILLDSSWSTQFASYAQDGVDRSYEAQRLFLFSRNDINAIVVYNTVATTDTQLVIANAGEYELSPNITLLVNEDTFNNTVNLFYVPQFPDIDAQYRHVNRFFELHAEDAGGLPIQPQQPYQITIYYQEATMPVDVLEEDLGLYYWNESAWVLDPTSQVDVARNLITATPSHFSRWAVLGEAIEVDYETIYLPIVTR